MNELNSQVSEMSINLDSSTRSADVAVSAESSSGTTSTAVPREEATGESLNIARPLGGSGAGGSRAPTTRPGGSKPRAKATTTKATARRNTDAPLLVERLQHAKAQIHSGWGGVPPQEGILRDSHRAGFTFTDDERAFIVDLVSKHVRAARRRTARVLDHVIDGLRGTSGQGDPE